MKEIGSFINFKKDVPLDENNKTSNLYNDCTGILLIGQDKITGNNIS